MLLALAIVQCDFCGRSMNSVEGAINEGWIPSYFDLDYQETCNPVCSDCVSNRLFVDDEGEFVDKRLM